MCVNFACANGVYTYIFIYLNNQKYLKNTALA